ncbi:MAG: hypothetical protein QOK01_3035 [Alphaproteobacteria bacterium]|jgi:hypothetical protein|nr:hypothetical protein [Alphaproteobacteria bacterium]
MKLLGRSQRALPGLLDERVAEFSKNAPWR